MTQPQDRKKLVELNVNPTGVSWVAEPFFLSKLSDGNLKDFIDNCNRLIKMANQELEKRDSENTIIDVKN